MYKVLIVDDEPLILEGLKHIIDWEGHGLEIVGEACYGTEAIEILNKTKVHILITDIKMPFMNGLELIRHIREKELNIKCIILSGYDDFEYVKEAAKLGIENYILKPVSEDELLSTLVTTLAKIESELHKQIEIRENNQILRENILYRWVTNNISSEELVKRADFLGISLKSDSYLAIVVSKLLRSVDGSSCPIADDHLLKYAVGNIISQTLTEEGLPFALFHDLEGDIVLLLAGQAAREDRSVLMEALKKCSENMRKFLKITAFMTAGSLETDVKSVHHSYTRAKRLQDDNLIPPSIGIIFWDEIEGSMEENKGGSIIKKVLGYIRNQYAADINLKTIAYEFDINPGYLGQLFKKETGDTFPNYLNKFRVEKAKELLANTSLKASEVSERIGYANNSNYFYTVFKKITGMSPSEFKGE